MSFSASAHCHGQELTLALRLAFHESAAYKLYPVRVRVVNIETDEVHYVTVAYVPVVRKLKESGADEKARLRRCAVLQRVLYMAFRTTIAASHRGEKVQIGDRILTAFPRLLLYLADLPEEKAILCMKSGRCARPCSSCDVCVTLASTPQALNARDRDVIRMLTTQLEVAGHRHHRRNAQRRADLEARTSAQSATPALAGFAGLSTAPFLLYKMIGFDVLHVLDLGVTRMLVHRLVRVFPHMCKNHYPLCGTTAATYRVANVRISHMGRRSLAPRLAPGFFAEEGKPQSTFTGAQQRSGVPILPFAANGLFGVGRRRPRRSPTLDAARQRLRQSRSTASSRTVDVSGLTSTQAPAEDAAIDDGDTVLFTAGEADDDEQLPRNFSFDWVAYHAVFGPTPMQDAVTAMFAEYAVLYGRIAGWATSTEAAPTTLQEAKDVAEHAEHFVVKFVTPILGVVHTPKVHKLLCHILDAIKMHGNLQNANTGGNEAQHKQDKVFYRRTNKRMSNFTQQIVRHAQGSREVLNRIKKEDDEAERSLRDGLPRIDGALAGSNASYGTRNSTTDGPVRVRTLERVTVGVLSQRPALSRLGAVIGLPPVSTLAILNALRIAARLDCGTLFSQLVRASPAFIGKPWYDAVLFDDDNCSSPHVAGQQRNAVMLVGEVRLIYRGAQEDMAVACMWEAVPPVPECPLAARSCTRLRWAVPRTGGDWVIRVIPASRIRRVVHVVPDFAELARRNGVEAIPPTHSDAISEHRGMRFFVNDFFPWAQQNKLVSLLSFGADIVTTVAAAAVDVVSRRRRGKRSAAGRNEPAARGLIAPLGGERRSDSTSASAAVVFILALSCLARFLQSEQRVREYGALVFAVVWDALAYPRGRGLCAMHTCAIRGKVISECKSGAGCGNG